MCYTYLIGWSSKNKWYYGVRVANKFTPENDLWKVYFTSSVHVEQFRKEFGEPDVIQIRKTFNNSNKAILYEQKILTRLKISTNEKWLNQHTGGSKFIMSRKGNPLSEKHKKNISESQKGAKNHRYGKEVSLETREKISSSLTGIKRTEQQKHNLKTNHASKHANYIPPMLGKQHSEETKKKLSEIKQGKQHSEETKKKLSKYRLQNFRPTIHSEETKKKMSESRKEYWRKKKGV